MLKDLALDDIEQLKNYRDTEPVTADDPEVIELAENMKKFDVLQAILVRHKRGNPGKYQLIFGHRRYVAAKIAGLMVIPSNIKDVADEDILEIQVTENLQRKDCHPMDEAIAFRALMKEKSYSIEGIAARFAKKPDFVALRLKLNDLIPDLQAKFKKNSLPLSHALILCRLRQEDQKEVAKNNWVMRTVEDLKDYIDRNVVRQLSSAPFKRDDETLNPSAGPCTTCKKRSGCNPTLFADIKEDDRCFDKGCYQVKLDAFFLRRLQTIIETKPEVHLLQTDDAKLSKEVSTLIRQMNVAILDNKSFHTYSYGKFKKKVKGFYLDGYRRGKTEDVYVQGSEKKADKDGKPAKRTLTDVREEIAGIEQRQKRALELDAEKTWKTISNSLEDLTNLPNIPWEKPLKQEELDACAAALLEALMSSGYDEEAGKVVGLKDFCYFDMEDARNIKNVTMPQILHLLRLFMLDKLNGGASHLVSPGLFMLMHVLKTANYLKGDVETLEATQEEEAAGRIARAEKRLTKLREELSELESKVKPKKSAAAEPSGDKAKKRSHTKAKTQPSSKKMIIDDEGEVDFVDDEE